MIEILVALVLSLLLVAGVINLFVGSKQTYRFYDALSRLQENGRLALDTIATDIRMAGYSGRSFSTSALPPDAVNLSPPSWLSAAAVTSPAVDSIRVRWFDPCPPGNAACSPASNQCDPTSPINGVCSRTYSIQPRTAGGVAPTCPSAGTSLFLQRQSDAAPQEWVEGVQAMQILYGICTTDADGDTAFDSVTTPPGYVTAANVAGNGGWSNVCSVRIDLLLVSLEDRIVTEPQAVFFPSYSGNAINPNDRCLRQAFSTTVRIRNRQTLR